MKKIFLLITCALLIVSCSSDAEYENYQENTDNNSIETRSDYYSQYWDCDITCVGITSLDGYVTSMLNSDYMSMTGHEQTIKLTLTSPSGDIGFRGGPEFAIVSYSSGDKPGKPVISGNTVTFYVPTNCGVGKKNRQLVIVLENTRTKAYRILHVNQSTNNKL